MPKAQKSNYNKPVKRKDESWAEYKRRLIRYYIDNGYPETQAVKIALLKISKQKEDDNQKE